MLPFQLSYVTFPACLRTGSSTYWWWLFQLSDLCFKNLKYSWLNSPRTFWWKVFDAWLNNQSSFYLKHFRNLLSRLWSANTLLVFSIGFPVLGRSIYSKLDWVQLIPVRSVHNQNGGSWIRVTEIYDQISADFYLELLENITTAKAVMNCLHVLQQFSFLTAHFQKWFKGISVIYWSNCKSLQYLCKWKKKVTFSCHFELITQVWTAGVWLSAGWMSVAAALVSCSGKYLGYCTFGWLVRITACIFIFYFKSAVTQ